MFFFKIKYFFAVKMNIYVLFIEYFWGLIMIEIYITSSEIKKYIFMIVLFNAIFPRILEQSGIMINIADNNDSSNVQRLPYENFIDIYDHYGLNRIAE